MIDWCWQDDFVIMHCKLLMTRFLDMKIIQCMKSIKCGPLITLCFRSIRMVHDKVNLVIKRQFYEGIIRK